MIDQQCDLTSRFLRVTPQLYAALGGDPAGITPTIAFETIGLIDDLFDGLARADQRGDADRPATARAAACCCPSRKIEVGLANAMGEHGGGIQPLHRLAPTRRPVKPLCTDTAR